MEERAKSKTTSQGHVRAIILVCREIQKTEEELAMSFTSLYSAFEEAAMNETAMADAGYDDDWVPNSLKLLLKISFRHSR